MNSSVNPPVSETTSIHNKAALRLVSTKDMSREDWLEVRKSGIGSSDAAAAVGLNPYQSQLELWMIKTGRDHLLPKDDPDDESSPMYWGTLLEPFVAQFYSRKTGRKVRRINAVLQHPDPNQYWMLANLDYTVVSDEEVQVLECKTAGEYGTKLWRDGVPEYIQCQVQHQLAVTGKKAADVCVLMCGQEVEIHRINRDDELIGRLIELEQQFWNWVESDTQPPADSSKSAGKALRSLYPRDNGETIDLSDDAKAVSDFYELMAVRNNQRIYQHLEDQLKHCLQERMGDATRAKFSDGDISWKRGKDSTGLDTKSLTKAEPELMEKLMTKYPLRRKGSRRFVVQENNPKNHQH